MNDTINADMRNFWNGDGGEKWLRFQETMDTNFMPFGRRAMAAAAILPGERVLDVGCGCGDTSHELARCVGPDGRVLGIDISEPILARAMSRTKSVTEGNVDFECGDAQVLRLEAGAYDVVFSRFGVMFFDDPVAAFKNLRRGLKSGGRIAFVCWQPAKDNEWVSTSLGVVANHAPLPTPPGPEKPGGLSFGDPERVNRILTASGYTGVAIDGFETPFTVGSNVDEAVAFLTQMGPASGAIAQSGAGETIKSRIAADLGVALGPYETELGVTMGSATWVVTARNP